MEDAIIAIKLFDEIITAKHNIKETIFWDDDCGNDSQSIASASLDFLWE